MESESKSAAYAALAVSTTGFAGARKTELPMDLSGLAEEALLRIAATNRERPDLSSHLPDDDDLDFDAIPELVRQTQSFAGVISALEMVAKTMSETAERQSEALQAMDTFIRIQDEELQMLWWLTGQRSRDHNCAFSDVPAEAQPLVFGAELANATQILPGPPSAPAMLSRAGVKDKKKIAVSTAINAADQTWLRRVLGDRSPSPVTMPLHFAISRQLETGPGDTWVAGWASATSVGDSLDLPGLTLGTLFYRERLLILFG
jgi:hypothetical protein